MCFKHTSKTLTENFSLEDNIQTDGRKAHPLCLASPPGRDNKTISCHQHGFQSKCSCISQLLECLNDWTDSLDNSLSTDVVYLDFAKAFDTVPHKRLIHKLWAYGIHGKVLRWITSYSHITQKAESGSSQW